ncbi:unnamed protein product, partial [Didymodactylos carnosus]
PFIKQKFGNLTDASAISFERVLVQNILHGLSPSLSDAITSIPRWLLIKAAFPHLMHACAASIEHSLHTQQQQKSLLSSSLSVSPSSLSQLQVPLQIQTTQMTSAPSTIPFSPPSPTSSSIEMSMIPRAPSQSQPSPLCRLSSTPSPSILNNQNSHRLGKTEIRLLHILHWMILDAFNVCKTPEHSEDDNKNYLLPLSTIQLFIYLFIPYVHTYIQCNEKEFLQNPDLSDGMKFLWQPLLEYRQPDVRMFKAYVKPATKYVDYTRNSFISYDKGHSNNTTSFINNNGKNRLSVFVESPTPIPTTNVIEEEQEEDENDSDYEKGHRMPSTRSFSMTPLTIKCDSQQKPLMDLTNYPTIPPLPPPLIVSTDGSSTSLYQQLPVATIFQQQIANKNSASSGMIDSDTTTTNSSINNLNYVQQQSSYYRAPLAHMSSICSISDSSRPTVSPQSPGTDKFNLLPLPSPTSTSSITRSSFVCAQCHQPLTTITNEKDSSTLCLSCIAQQQQQQQQLPFTISGPPTSSNPSLSTQKSKPMNDIQKSSMRKESLITTTKKKAHYSSDMILLASYFDIGILRTLFSPSWLTDGYLWCLEYLHKRIIDISDELLSDTTLSLLRIKSLSIPQINIKDEQEYYDYMKSQYFNEQITNDIVEQQCMMTTIPNTTMSTSKHPQTLLNVPFKNFGKYKHNQKYDNFYKKISKIRYIDEEGAEHFDHDKRSEKDGAIHPQHSRRLLVNEKYVKSIPIVDSKERPSTIKSTHNQSEISLQTVSNITLPIIIPSVTNDNKHKMDKQLSVSDTDINYKFLEEIEEAQGSSAYINRDGTINFGVLLAGIHAVICKEHHLKVCELVMNILDVLLGLAVIASSDDDIHKRELLIGKAKTTTTNSGDDTNYQQQQQSGQDKGGGDRTEEWMKAMDAKEDDKFQLGVDITLRIIKRLGCPHCQPRARNFTSDQLRGKVRLSLNKLRTLNQRRFEKYFLDLTLHGDLVHILDIFHALCGYCSDSSVGLAHYAPYIPIKNDLYARQTYSNNFGNTHLGYGPKGVEGFILGVIFKPFVTRLVVMKEYLMSSENVGLYSECRAFLTCVKENHGGIFRLVAFSSLLDSAKKIKQEAELLTKQQQANSSSTNVRHPILNKQEASGGKSRFSRDLSDDVDIDKNIDSIKTRANSSAQIHPSTDENSVLAGGVGIAPSSSIKFKGRPRASSSDERTLYTHPEETLYVDLTLIRFGLLRLNFMMESCPPGSVPDPQFINSLLTLAPVIAKASYLLECAYFVRRCSIGQWPEWMKINLTTFRPHDSFPVRNGNMNSKMNKLYQAAAARMFYVWGEALSAQLECILDNENNGSVNRSVNTGDNEILSNYYQQQQNDLQSFWNYDETPDDYYNEAIVNRSGRSCSYSLRMMACLLLLEITSFLRESYDSLPKLSSLSQKRPVGGTTSTGGTNTENYNLNEKRSSRTRIGSVASHDSNRSSPSISSEHPARMSIKYYDQFLNNFLLLVSPQMSSAPSTMPVPSATTATIINIGPLPNVSSTGERHISFAVSKENDSSESNHTAINMPEDDVVIVDGNASSSMNDRRMSIAPKQGGGKSKLIRRSSVKLRRPSLRMKDSKSIRRPSYRFRRRSHASNMSSETDHQSGIGSQIEPSDVYNVDEEFDNANFDDMINTKPFPWIKVVIRVLNDVHFGCDHMKCSKNCYEKQTASCKNLIQALLNTYRQSSTVQTMTSSFSRSSSATHRSKEHILKRDNTRNEIKKRRLSTCLFGEGIDYHTATTTTISGHNTHGVKTNFEMTFKNVFETADPCFEQQINTHFTGIASYLEKQVGTLFQVPLMILCKSSVLLEDEHYAQVLTFSWELLLDKDEELAACAATIVILTAARAGHLVDKLFHNEMENVSGTTRYNAILKFQTLWRFRYQFWIRLEEGAHSMMKILPPSIEFVLPSPALGISNLHAVDPPWLPHAKTRVEQVALNQEEVRAVVTASKTRKKHQQELLHTALLAEETSKRVARENFAMTNVPILQSASFEPLLYQQRDEDEEAHNDDDRFVESVQIRQAQGAFPSSFGVAVFLLVEMLEDEEIVENGATVSEAARKVLWTCLLDEPSLLIRFFFEKLSHKERRSKSLQILRRLMICLADIPPQFAHAVFNYVLGLLMSMVRSPLDGSQELIAAALTLLWQIIPYLHGLVLKDLKQILRKEQAEQMILITGNIPSTKKVIIHGPDLSQIPTQAIIQEDTQFSAVLQEALDFFGIPESKRDRYYLVDVKTTQIHIPDTYVRDFYFFRRNVYPQLSLVYMEHKQAQKQLEHMSLFLKTTELSKVLFARHLLENTQYTQIHNSVTFFHDELMKCPFFPRKPLESDYNLYMKMPDKELFNLDMLHKYNWIKLISCMFFNMDGKTSTTWDITLFLNVINGAFILHCEDFAMLRYCLATYISTARHYKHIFATNGYLLIMPTFLRVYSNIQSNPMLKKAIEYCCRQFYILHRVPFILQMLGSVSQLLDFDEQADITDTNKIQPMALFRLLVALEYNHNDALKDDYSILELVKDDKHTTAITNGIQTLSSNTLGSAAVTGIKTLDFCYAEDDSVFTLLNCFDVCITVVAYAPDSIRSLQMLGIIDLLLPRYLEYLNHRTTTNDLLEQAREEIKIIEKLSISIKTMITASDTLTRTFAGPKHETLSGTSYKYSRGSNRSPSIVPDEDSMSRFIDDRKNKVQDADEHKQASEYRWPRDTLLSVISTFVHFSTKRLKKLIKLVNDPQLRVPELLDAKCHTRLADIAHTLLKLGGYDSITMSCRGLQNYFQKLLPCTNWSQETLRPALNNLLRRMDRMFSKISKKPMSKRCFDWEATAGILNGIYLTLDRHPYIAHFPYLKMLVSECIALVLNENITDSSHSVPRFDTLAFPKAFSRAVIKLVGRYLLAIKNQPNLEALSGGGWSFPNAPSAINHLLHFLLPLMFWAGSGRKDAPKIHPIDLSYVITILINSLKPTSKLASAMGTGAVGSGAGGGSSGQKQHLTIGEALMSNSFTHKSMRQLKDLHQTASLLGLKVLIISFTKYMKKEWQRIAQAIKLMCAKQANISSTLLSFIDFIVSYKTPIFVLLRPYLFHYTSTITCENDRDYELISQIQQKLIFDKLTQPKCTGEILNGLMSELNQLKAELTGISFEYTRELSRQNVRGKKRVILPRAPRRRKRDDLFVRPVEIDRLSSVLDESKTSFHYDAKTTEKVRFDTEAIEMKDRDGGGGSRANAWRIRRQQSSDSSLNSSPRKKTEKIRIKEALDILDVYRSRYRIRSGVEVADIPIISTTNLTLKRISGSTDDDDDTITQEIQSVQNQSHVPYLSRSITVSGDRSLAIDKRNYHEKSVQQTTEPKMRTFRGLKRDTAQRLTKGPMKVVNLSESVPTMTYDATKEMNEMFHPTSKDVQVLSSRITDHFTPLLEQQQQQQITDSSHLEDSRVSSTTGDAEIIASLFASDHSSSPMSSQNKISLTPLILSLPLSPPVVTTISRTTIHASPFNRAEIWVSRLPEMPNVSDADYESQV